MHVRRWLWLLALLPCVAQATTVSGAWRPAQPDDSPAQVLAQARNGELTRFNPAHLHAFSGTRGAWIVLQPQASLQHGPLTLTVRSPTLSEVTLYHDGQPWLSTSVSDSRALTRSHGRLAFPIPEHWSRSAPLLLKFEPGAALTSTVTFRLQSTSNFYQTDALWLSMASASFGAMLTMAIMALCFALILRDLTFLWYAGYVISYVMVQAGQTGFLTHPLGWQISLHSEQMVNLFFVAMSVSFAMVFMSSFCDVRRHAARMRLPLLSLAAAMVVLAILRCIDIPPLPDMTQAALNPLLILCAMVTLVVAVLCALRGSRTAWFFLAGWTPLLALTVLVSIQVLGMLPSVDWLNNVLIVAGAVESIVLSIGLAYRELAIRHERDHARVLANLDALTGLLNRRAWSDAATVRVADVTAHPQALLFLDIDHFKTLNDTRGHEAGDTALLVLAQTLREQLRPGDLLGRYGGEEFVVLISNVDMTAAMQLAARLRQRVRAMHISLNNVGMQLTASIGVACLRKDDSLASLVKRADAAMYQAKTNGRNRVMLEPGSYYGHPAAGVTLRPGSSLES